MRSSAVFFCLLCSFLMATNHPNSPLQCLTLREFRLHLPSLRNGDLIVAADPPGMQVIVRERREGNTFFRILYLRDARAENVHTDQNLEQAR